MSTNSYRILLLGDFGGREHRGLSDAASLGDRRVRRVDRDDVDRAMAGMTPEVRLTIDPASEPIAVRFSGLDDFHPDRLVETVPDFQRLRALRAQSANSPSAPAQRLPPAPSTRAAAAAMTEGSVLDLILSNEPGSEPHTRAAAPPDELSEYVQRAVTPHLVSQPSAEQEGFVAKVDAVIEATMRVVLHHRDFQAAEALWRGVDFLVRRLDTDESLQVYLVDVTRTELLSALAHDAGDAAKGLRRVLRGETQGAKGAWSLAVGLYTVSPSELPLVASIASMAKELGVPWISAADARFAGVETFAGNGDPDDWDSAPNAGWEAVRRGDGASWLALAQPRFLLRVPYGERTDECERIELEETDDGRLAHESFLWGNAALLGALILGEGAADGDPLPAQGTVSGLPLYVATIDGIAEAAPCAEAVIPQRGIMRLLDRGLSAVASERDGDAVRIPRLQSVASPATPLASAGM